MNLVFQALVLLAFLLPGLIFRSVYFKGGWKYPLGHLGPISEQVPRALIHAAWINGVWAALVCFAHQLMPPVVRPVDFDSVVCWVSNNFGKDQAKFDGALRALTISPGHVLFYFLGLYACSWALAKCFHKLVRGLKLDRKYS